MCSKWAQREKWHILLAIPELTELDFPLFGRRMKPCSFGAEEEDDRCLRLRQLGSEGRGVWVVVGVQNNFIFLPGYY